MHCDQKQVITWEFLLVCFNDAANTLKN